MQKGNYIILVCCILLGLTNCYPNNTPKFLQSEDRLKERIHKAYALFLDGKFERFMDMRSERIKSSLFRTKDDKKELFKQWEKFIKLNSLSYEVVSVRKKEKKAIVEMKLFLIEKNKTKTSEILYDLWFFENGDWFLDNAHRISPEYLTE